MKFTDSSKCFLKNERKGVLRCDDWARWVGKSFEFLVLSFEFKLGKIGKLGNL